jgi:hypothetical protein
MPMRDPRSHGPPGQAEPFLPRGAAFGESRPLVPTADGAREPQSRRVEIALR